MVISHQQEAALQVARHLGADGHEPLVALSGAEARRLLAAGLPELILLDASLQDVSGLDLCREIKASPATLRVPVVLMVAAAGSEHRARGIQAGCDEFLAMPVHPDELRVRVRSLLKWQAARRALGAEREASQALANDHAQVLLRRTLERHVSASQAAQVLAQGGDPFAVESAARRDALVVCAELQGLARMVQERPPLEVMLVLDRYLAVLTEVAHRHGGAVFGGTGEAPLLAFGVPLAVPDALRVGLAAARDIVLQMAEPIAVWQAQYGVSLAVGLGASHGDVVVGHAGPAASADYMVLGEAVADARRLAGQAQAGEIVCAATLRATAVTMTAQLMDERVLEPGIDAATSACGYRAVPAVPPIRVLIIDDAPDVRALVRKFIKVDWPQAEVTEYDPLELGRPPANYDWRRFDVVLLDYMLGTDDDGLDWLRQFRTVKAMPPIIFMTGGGNEAVAAKAIKLGAVDYLTKQDLSRRRLTEALKEAISEAASGAAAAQRAASEVASVTGFVMGESAGSGPAQINIGGYRMVRKLGEGGMAVVFLAEHLESGERRVLKILDTRLSADSDFLDRFIHEYGVISRVSSPHVIRIYDQGFTSEHAYISMEYLGGGDLKARIRRGLAVDDTMRIFRELLEALKAVHDAGVVHRDLKPHNVMFRDDGSLVLVDFGIAKAVDGAHGLTQTGMVIGTPLYMSPEQGQGLEIDYRADLYSAGVILYEMLTGRLPYESDTIVGLIHQHCEAPVPQLPRELADYQILITRLMAKKPEDRYQSAHALLPGS